MTALHWLGAAELAKAYRARETSPVQVTAHLLERIERLNPTLSAFVRVDRDGAMAAARHAETEMAAGIDRGKLHGVPVAIKDMIDVAGLPTTCQSRILLDNIAKTDAVVVARLRAAGAIVLGKTATHEFGVGGPAFDLPFPPARNPWNTDHHPGGSSSGSGSAVAAGLCPIALGTDSGGSVRHPASACGIVGLKQTPGVVPRTGAFPTSATLDEVGAIARNVEDAGLVLETIAGFDPRDPMSRPRPPLDLRRTLAQGLKGLRVGFVRHFHEADMDADAEVVAALNDAAITLQAHGAELRDVTLPNLREMDAICLLITQPELSEVHAAWLRECPQDYCELSRRALLSGQFIAAGDYIRALQRRLEIRAAIERVFETVDILLTASSMYPACRIDDRKAIDATYGRQARSAFTASGHPAISLMSGLSKAGLPLSLQLVAPLDGEAVLLRAAHGYERIAGWHNRRPPDLA